MKKLTALLILLTCTFFTNCVTVENLQFKTDPKKEVDIFMSKKPERAYSELGYYTASASIFHSHKRILRRLRERAKKDTIDALIQVEFTYVFWWPTVTGLAIKYND